MDLSENYWTEKYLNNQTGWDIGFASPSIVDYFKNIKNKEVKILVPGGGNGYEVQALFEMGFHNIYLLDFARPPLNYFSERMPEFPLNQLIQSDFFKHHGAYDFIIEQTFFCALDPKLRDNYVQKMQELLKPNGTLIGLLFNIPLNKDHPPFGGDMSQYQPLFKKHFNILKLEECKNSIPQRAGNEVFIEMKPLEM